MKDDKIWEKMYEAATAVQNGGKNFRLYRCRRGGGGNSLGERENIYRSMRRYCMHSRHMRGEKCNLSYADLRREPHKQSAYRDA